MRLFIRNVFFALGAISLFLTWGTRTQAETCNLELKQLDAEDSSNVSFDSLEFLYRQTYPQSFYRQTNVDAQGSVTSMGDAASNEKFKKLVKKEPKYNAKQPFFGVAKIGSQEYLFVFDSAVPTPSEDKKADKKKEDAKEEKGKKEAEAAKQESKSKSFSEWLSAALFGESAKSARSPLNAEAKTTAGKVAKFERLYFDSNHNGDLTDDKVIEGKVQHEQSSASFSYVNITFPRVDVMTEVDGAELKTGFFFTVSSHSSGNSGYFSAQMRSSAYRIGEISLDGKKHCVVLLDFNSNGLFNDETKILDNVMMDDGQIYSQQGDSILIDPTPPKSGVYFSPYDLTASSYRYNVGKIICVNGKYYEMQASSSGDKISLEPLKTDIGSVTNPNEEYAALIYGDQGILKIQGKKDVPVAVPVGEWKLLQYTITKREQSAPANADAKESSLMKTYKQLGGVKGAEKASFVAATGTRGCKAVKVVKGETVPMPFGPPYTPHVTAAVYNSPSDVQLAMSLIGSAGEVCRNMTCDNQRPGAPHFEITDPKGKVVEQGDFEYG